MSASFKDQTAFFTFTSFTVPSVVYSFDTKTYDLKEYFRPNINFDFDNYEVKQIFYKSKDGTEVPMFIVHKKGLELNGQNPTLLYGYGGFNASMMPSFAPSRLVWLENGGVYALANIRGGGEYGENWYRSGTKLNKQNVFDDFIAALKSDAETIRRQRNWPPRGSNGTLIGA